MQETTVDLLRGIWEIVADTVKSKLNTLFELEKKKASLNYLAEGQPKKTITASLSFLPPIMTILKVEKDKRTRGENGVEKQRNNQ